MMTCVRSCRTARLYKRALSAIVLFCSVMCGSDGFCGKIVEGATTASTCGKTSFLRIELHPNHPLRLGEVVAKHGPPENVYAAVGGEGYIEYIVILDYPSTGMKYSSVSKVGPEKGEGIVSDEDVGTVGEDMRVTLAVYFAPTSFEDALRNVFLYEEELVAQDLGSVQEWKGFGPVELDLYYPPRQ